MDVTVVCPFYITYHALARAVRGAAAAHAGDRKRYKYRNDIPGHVHFMPLPFESEGYISATNTPIIGLVTYPQRLGSERI